MCRLMNQQDKPCVKTLNDSPFRFGICMKKKEQVATEDEDHAASVKDEDSVREELVYINDIHVKTRKRFERFSM